MRIQLQSIGPHAATNARHWGLHSLHFVAQGPGPIWPGPWPAGAQTDAPTSALQLLQRLQIDPDEAMVTDALLSCQVIAPHGLPLGLSATFDTTTGQMQELMLMRLGPWLPSHSVPTRNEGQA